MFEIRSLLDDSVRRWGADSPVVSTIPVMLGDALLMADQPAAAMIQVGRIDEAEREFLIAADRVDWPPIHSCTFATRRGLARVAAVRGQFEYAASEYTAVATSLTELYGVDHPSTIEARFDVADILLRSSTGTEAVAMHRDVLAARTRVLGAHHPDTRTSAAAPRR